MSPEVWRYGRVGVRHPGKYGEKDCRVEFNGAAPTHAEIVALVAWVFFAERRYDKPGQEGPLMLMGFLKEAMHAANYSELESILQRIEDSKPDSSQERDER